MRGSRLTEKTPDVFVALLVVADLTGGASRKAIAARLRAPSSILTAASCRARASWPKTRKTERDTKRSRRRRATTRWSQVPVGTYHLNIELAGFGRFRQEGIRIFVGQTARIDAKLQVGNLAEEVNVVADASLLDTQSAEIASSVTSENLNSLPLNFGARGNFSRRRPFAIRTRSSRSFPAATSRSYSSLKVGGAPINTFQIRVEGMEANNHRLMIRIDQVQPSVESLEEMTVHTSNFAAEYGQVAGGIFNLTAKSGTNTYPRQPVRILRERKIRRRHSLYE